MSEWVSEYRPKPFTGIAIYTLTIAQKGMFAIVKHLRLHFYHIFLVISNDDFHVENEQPKL